MVGSIVMRQGEREECDKRKRWWGRRWGSKKGKTFRDVASHCGKLATGEADPQEMMAISATSNFGSARYLQALRITVFIWIIPEMRMELVA